jgi:hypothetical protein
MVAPPPFELGQHTRLRALDGVLNRPRQPAADRALVSHLDPHHDDSRRQPAAHDDAAERVRVPGSAAAASAASRTSGVRRSNAFAKRAIGPTR